MDSLIEANKKRLLDTKSKMFETINKEIDINKNRELSAMRKKFTEKLEILKKDGKISEDIIDNLNEFFLEELQTYDSAITAETMIIIEDKLMTYDSKSDLLRMNIIRRKIQDVEEAFCDITNASIIPSRKKSSVSVSSTTSEDIDYKNFIGRFNFLGNVGIDNGPTFNFNSEDEDNGITHCNSDNDSDTEISIISTEQQLNLNNVIEIRSIASKNGVIVSQSGRKKSKAELISELLDLENIVL
jgi:hypothetical protein